MKRFKILMQFSMLTLFLSGCAQLRASEGWDLLNKGQPDKAIEKFESSRKKKQLPGYYLGMYNSFLMKQDVETGKRYLDQGLERYQDDFHLNFAMGNYYLDSVKNRNPKLAKKYFEKCNGLKPGSARDLLNEAISRADVMITTK